MREIEARLGGWVIAARWPIIVITLILVAVAASGARFLEFSSDYRVYFNEDNPQLLAFEALQNTYTKSGNVFFAVVPDDRDATSTLALEAAAWLTERAWKIPYSTRVDSITNFQHTTADGDDLVVRDLVDEAVRGDAAERYKAQPETIHVSVITDTFRQLNKSMHGDDPTEYRLPASRELAAQYLLLYEMSLPYGLDLNNQLDVDKSATRMTVATQTLSSNEVLALDRRAQQWLADHAPNIARAEGSGTTLMFAYLGRRNIVSMLFATTVALIGISIVLIAALRSLRLGLTSLVPNLVPGAMGFGIWGLAVGEVGLSLSVVTTMTLGIVVDDTVHFLSKYRRARSELGYAPPDAVRYAFVTVGRALLTTSLVLVAGFAVLSLSSFELNSGMGQLTALIIALALIADFFLLPPLLMKVEGDSDEDTAVDRAARDHVPA